MARSRGPAEQELILTRAKLGEMTLRPGLASDH
jgi:hypothetical protein